MDWRGFAKGFALGLGAGGYLMYSLPSSTREAGVSLEALVWIYLVGGAAALTLLVVAKLTGWFRFPS